VHFFLWLLSQNRLLTRDNLQKRRVVDDPTCLFCSKQEFICHLFFECIVAVSVWRLIYEILDVDIGRDYESMAKLWIANKKHLITNVVSSATLWSLWKLRNELCFQGVVWIGMRMVLVRVSRMLRGWLPLYKKEAGKQLESLIVKLEESSRHPALLTWRQEIVGASSSQLDQLDAQSSTSARSSSVVLESFEP
jgi:hypothetical protein